MRVEPPEAHAFGMQATVVQMSMMQATVKQIRTTAMSDHALNVAFVKTVQRYPCLYDYSLSEYVNRDRTDEAWGEVAKRSNLSMLECKRKWKNLRSVFVRKSKAPTRQGRNKPYYLNKCMAFLTPYIKAGTSRNIEPASSEPVTAQEDDEDEPDDEQQEGPMLEDYNGINGSDTDNAAGVYTTSPQKKNNRPQSNPDVEQEIIEYLKNKHFNDPARTKSNRRFLLSLLPDLDSMTLQEEHAGVRRRGARRREPPHLAPLGALHTAGEPRPVLQERFGRSRQEGPVPGICPVECEGGRATRPGPARLEARWRRH